MSCPLHDPRRRFVLRLAYALQLRGELAGLTDAQVCGAVAVGRSLGLEAKA
ncbi:MAG TPA: hypothetical protein PKA64_04155 [Myxococcota bacterium]|nr:hypothetical protein [Myxococcota bacterium]